MRQSRSMSLAESLANVAVGYGIAVATQAVVFPMFGLHASLSENAAIGAVFTVVSILRSYLVRRLFERLNLTLGELSGGLLLAVAPRSQGHTHRLDDGSAGHYFVPNGRCNGCKGLADG